MDPTDGAVRDDIFEVRVTAQRREHACEHALARPAAEALEYRVPVAEGGWQITPRRAGAGNPEHGFNKQAVVYAGSPGIAGLAGQQVGDLIPLRVAEARSIQDWSPLPALNPNRCLRIHPRENVNGP